jgi:adenylate cyclase
MRAGRRVTAGLFAELRRRNVFRAGLAWLALAWLLIAIADLLFPAFGFPDAVVRWLIIGLALALLPVMVFAWLFRLTPEGLRLRRGPQDDDPVNARAGRRTDQLTLVLLLLAVGFSAVKQFVLPQRVTPPAQVEAPAPAPVPAPDPRPPAPPGPVDPRSIAVLPFANLSPDPENAYLADGMAEEILNVLARVEGLKVASRTSSFSLRDQRLGSREIGRQLGVAHVLDGSVRRQGEQLRITAQLVAAATDQQLWSGTFDRQLTDIFTLQEEIAQAITDSLADTLGVRKIEVRQATADLQAYELYLRGRQLFAQRGANLAAARELLEQALARDPGFAEAWATLAGALYVTPSYSSELSGEEAVARARAAAERALALLPGQPDALAVSGRIAAERGDRVAAAELIERALEADPNNANTWTWRGLVLIETGHIGAARDAFEHAMQLDPLSGIHIGWLGTAQLFEGDHAAADDNLKRAHALGWRGPASFMRLKLALAGEPGADVARRFEDWLHDDGRIAPEHRATHEAVLPAVRDPAHLEAARAAIEAAVQSWPENEWAQLYLLAGLPDEAIAEALRPKPVSGQILLMLIWSSVDRAFREHPRFMELAARDGLTALWDRHGDPDHCRLAAGPPPRMECER